MGRGECTFRQRDVTAALKAARDAGVHVARVEIDRSVRLWTETKKDLSFAEVTQDGDDEGCLRLRHLPTSEQATAIRRRLGLRKRKTISEAERARLRAIGFTTNRDFSAADTLTPADPVSDIGSPAKAAE